MSSTLEVDAVTELTRLGITKLGLLAAVKDEEELKQLVTSRVKWEGEQDKHAAKGLGLVLAWRKARERFNAREAVAPKRSAGGEAPPMESH